ncbi:TonB-dependent receptor [Sphingobium sp. H39-3-25]|uniref:TonB-dependent receptor n=1 Tax=Sphingobium arseniciresistens TaxID=3030834 RepID=UPI0023B9E78F|nr:TonB-dependent receptor [Sphingobium arseniciresistens]
MEMNFFRYFCSASVLALLATPAIAQENAGSPEPAAGDIIVTANRTESLLSKTPIAITAITGDGLRDAGVTNPTALAEQVPNVAIQRNNAGLQITIRGVTSSDVTEKGDPSAAFLLDGVYIARPQAQEVSFFDVARVEVLRGPQGTLYGRNTTAGVINVITNRPTFDFGGSAEVSYGNYNALQASTVLNLPASDRLAFRASVNFDQRDNYINFGPRTTSTADQFKKNLSVRLQGLYKWDSGDLLLRGDYADIQGNVFDLVALRNFYGPTTTGVDPVHFDRSSDGYLSQDPNIGWDLFRRNSSKGIGLELNQDIGPLTLTYVGSYRNFKRNESDARITPDASSSYRVQYYADYNQQSHELRFATNGSGPLKLQFGGYYFKEDSDLSLLINLGRPNPGPNGDGTSSGFFQGPTKAESYAFFGQSTYSFTDSLRLTGGIRYSHDTKSRIGRTISCASYFNCTPASTSVPNNNAEGTFSKTTWRVGLDYDVSSRTLLYGSVASGYKAGGFNDGCEIGTGPGCAFSADTLYYDPETLTAYEAGVKTRLFDDLIRLNLAGFYYDYNDIQLTQVVDDCGGGITCRVTQNGGKAKVKGIEAETVFQLTDNDRIDVSATYLDAHYSNFSIPPYDFAGKPLDHSPKWTVSGGYQHTFPLENGGRVTAGVRSFASAKYSLISIGTANFYHQPSFSKTDVTVTYKAPDDRWFLQGFIKNIENNVIVNAITIGTRSAVAAGDPRTFGARAGVKF